MHIDLNRHRNAIELVVAIFLVLVYSWLTVACVWELYSKGAKSKVPIEELKSGSQ